MASDNKYRSNYHYKIIKADRNVLFSEIVKWGQAQWWPKGSLMQFLPLSEGKVSKGSRYVQKVKLPFGPSWDTEVTDIQPDHSLTRRFHGDLFEGQECVSLKPLCCHNVKVEYEMLYRIKGVLNEILWEVILKRLHDGNIDMILDSLKAHAERSG